jgi:hypothetical protein
LFLLFFWSMPMQPCLCILRHPLSKIPGAPHTTEQTGAVRRNAARMNRIGLALFADSLLCTPDLAPVRQVIEETGQ